MINLLLKIMICSHICLFFTILEIIFKQYRALIFGLFYFLLNFYCWYLTWVGIISPPPPEIFRHVKNGGRVNNSGQCWDSIRYKFFLSFVLSDSHTTVYANVTQPVSTLANKILKTYLYYIVN